MKAAVLHAVESEFAVLGAAMIYPEHLEAVFARLTPAHFDDPVLSRIYGAVLDLIGADRMPHPALIRDRLSNDDGFEKFGGITALGEMCERASTIGIGDHADAIIDRAGRRSIIATAEQAIRAAGDLSGSAFDVVADMERSVSAMLHAAAPDDAHLVDQRTAAIQRVQALHEAAVSGRRRGLMTGLYCFDRFTHGLMPGWLIVIGGRPSMGKTALARSTAMAAALGNPDKVIVYFALEMDRQELSDRTLSELSFLDRGAMRAFEFHDIGGDKLEAEDRLALETIATRAPANFIIDDSPVLNISHIRRRLYALKARGHDLGAVFIDYLQIMERPADRYRTDAALIGDITQALKQLARELGICIVLLSQVNRGVEGRDDKRPTLADLRESGSIEQDANAVMFVYREHYYLSRAKPKSADKVPDWEAECANIRTELEVLIPKVRGGPDGRALQTYHPEFDHVENRAR